MFRVPRRLLGLLRLQTGASSDCAEDVDSGDEADASPPVVEEVFPTVKSVNTANMLDTGSMAGQPGHALPIDVFTADAQSTKVPTALIHDVQEKVMKKKTSRPTYKVMIQEAIDNTEMEMGLSRQEIKQYMEDQYDFATVSASHFNKTLKSLTEEGKLIQSNSGKSWMLAESTATEKSKLPNLLKKSGGKSQRG